MSSAARPARTEGEIREWIVDRLRTKMRIDPAELRLDEPIASHGVDSMHIVALVGELEDWLGCRISGNPLQDYPSVNALARHLAEESAARATVKRGSGG